jgi:hypothetical protein
MAQVKGSKPRFKPAGKTHEITRQKVSELSEEYLRARNAKLRAQGFMAETQAAERRGQLIEKRVIQRQASYIFITLRQAILNFPSRYSRRMVRLHNEHQARQELTKAAHEFLRELTGFAEKVMDPGWLASVEADAQDQDTGKPAPAAGHEIKREQEKAKVRRQKKAATMRKLRAAGRVK